MIEMIKNLEKIALRTYELVKDLNQKVDYLIERGDFDKSKRYED